MKLCLRFSKLIFAAVVMVAFGLAARPHGLTAAPVPEGADLAFVPADALAVASFHVADLWKHPAGKTALHALSEGLPDALKAFRGQFGVGPEEVDRVTLFWLALPPKPIGGDEEPLAAVTTLKPYDPKAVLAAAAPNAKEQKVKGRSLYANVGGPSFYFRDDQTILLGTAERLETYLGRTEGAGERPLAPILRLADKHLIAAGWDVASTVRARPLPADPNGPPPDAAPLLPLLKARLATLTVDLDDHLRANAQVTFATAADARDGTAAVDAALDKMREWFGQEIEFQKPPLMKDAPKTTALFKDVQTALRAARAGQNGAVVEVKAAMAVDAEVTTAAVNEVVEKAQAEAKRAKLTKELKELALAAHIYNDALGNLPPAAITDKNGKPLLSWRVALLPFIEQGKLYTEFHLDEPWDSDHNKKLLAKMPAIFAPPDSQAFKDHETPYQAITGKNTVFDGTKVTLVQITDGTSNTFLFVEAKKAVPWTKPEDFPTDTRDLASKLGGRVEGKFMAAMCDGSVRFFPLTMKDDVLRVWATRNNGQVRPEPDK